MAVARSVEDGLAGPSLGFRGWGRVDGLVRFRGLQGPGDSFPVTVRSGGRLSLAPGLVEWDEVPVYLRSGLGLRGGLREQGGEIGVQHPAGRVLPGDPV